MRLKEIHLVYLDLFGKEWVPCRGPRGLGRVFGERLAARRYERTAVTAPNPHAPRATENRPAPLHAGARSTRRGLRVGVADSLERGFV